MGSGDAIVGCQAVCGSVRRCRLSAIGKLDEPFSDATHVRQRPIQQHPGRRSRLHSGGEAARVAHASLAANGAACRLSRISKPTTG